jgi:PAS domain S-box-containing protein
MKYFTLIASVLLSLGIPVRSPGYASSDDFNEPWRWTHFTTESGLPADEIHGVLEARDGTVWVQTAAGLAWFDGFQWIPMDTSDGLPAGPLFRIMGEVRDSLVVSDGRNYYIGTRVGFRPLTIGPDVGGASVGNDEFIFLRGTSIYRYRDGIVEPCQLARPTTEGRVITMTRTRSGSVWLTLVDGIYRWEDGIPKLKIRAGSAPLGPSAIVENRNGSGIVALQFPAGKRGLWEWEGQAFPRRNEAEQPDNIKTMDISDAGEVIAVYPSDEVRFRRNGVWSPASFNNPLIRDVSVVAFRHNGDLWVGTQHGLFLYRRSSSRWTYWNHPPPDMRNSVNEILQTRSGDIWVASSNGIEIHDTSGAVRRISAVNGVPLYVATGLAEDPAGNVWVSSGASFSGLFRWDGKRWDHVPIGDDTGGICFHKIRVDHQGRLWALGIGKFYPPIGEVQPGAYCLDHGRFRRWGVRDGLSNGRVYSFADGSDGTLWFGTYGGISRFRNGTWKHWTTKEGLHGPRVFTMTTDRENTLWFGDYDDRSGLGYIDKSDSIHYFTTADGLVNNNIWDIRCDDDGRVWIATRGGLSSYHNGVWSTFDEKSGLTYLALWPVLPLKEHVYVGTRGKGVAILHRELTSAPYPRIVLDKPLRQESNIVLRWRPFAYWAELTPAEIMSRVRIDDNPWTPWQRLDEITLTDVKPGSYSYTVQAKGLFGNFDEKGVDGEFIVPLPLYLRPLFLLPVGILGMVAITLGVVLLVRKRNHDIALQKSEEKFRTVTETTASAIFIYHHAKILFVNTTAERLTGYSKGELLSKNINDIVHASDRELVASHEIAPSGDPSTHQRYECRIVTKPGEVRWVDFASDRIDFQGMSVRLGTASDITERKLIEQKLRLLTSELSITEERERRRMASYLHDVIGQTLTLCKLKIRSIQRSTSSDSSERTLQELRELIEQSITNTQSLTFELCPPILYELNLESAIEWLAEQFQMQHSMIFEVEDDGRPKPVRIEDRVILFQAVREVFMNVVKHSGAKKVRIRVGREDSTIRIVIHDDGVGFDVDAKAIPDKAAGGGFGLFNIRERLGSLGGLLSIDSSPEKGTTVSISSPLTDERHAAADTSLHTNGEGMA